MKLVPSQNKNSVFSNLNLCSETLMTSSRKLSFSFKEDIDFYVRIMWMTVFACSFEMPSVYKL